MKVLVALAGVRPGVLSRDRLIDMCWDGRIVGDDALNRCILALRHLARQFPIKPYNIQTVPRVGYCLVERQPSAVAPERVEEEAGAKQRKRSRSVLIAAATVAAVLVLVVFLWQANRTGRSGEPPASIAVLPFRNLSNGDAYFAEGVGEEILSQLAREPQFRVAGRTSSAQFRNAADTQEIARRLKVDYLLEGSVRTQNGRVRVSAALLRGSDGIRLWADDYDGRLHDVFDMQQEIGKAVAVALRRKLARASLASVPRPANGEAYNLYLTARGLIRTRNRKVGGDAANLLRDAIKLDPRYAPAWASLAHAVLLDSPTFDHETAITRFAQSERYARHALRLSPDLAEAHGIMGVVLGHGSAEAQAHLRRAAKLDSGSAENLIWLGHAHRAAGEFEQEFVAYRRAAVLDPLWFRSVREVAHATAEMGDRDAAEAIARQGHRDNQISQHMLLGRIAAIFGDYSEATRRWSIVARADSPRWSDTAEIGVQQFKFRIGLGQKPPPGLMQPDIRNTTSPVWMDLPPAPALWRLRNRNRIAAQVYSDENQVAVKMMLNAGRASELAATYRSPTGLLGIRPGQPLRIDQLGEAPLVALALRESGRAAEADRLLQQAEAAIRTVYRRGRVPFWFDADAAAVFAARGRSDQALQVLERALARGWTHSGSTDLPGIADEPAFRLLRGHPRFERTRARLDAHYAREHRETALLLK